MSWLLKFAGVKAYAAFAVVLVVLGALWFTQVAALRSEVSDAKAATALAEKNLSDRIAAEATAIADAVTKAREEEQTKLKDQEVKYAQLLESNRTTRTALAGAEQRLRKLAAEATGRESTGGPADSSAVASRMRTPAPTNYDQRIEYSLETYYKSLGTRSRLLKNETGSSTSTLPIASEND